MPTSKPQIDGICGVWVGGGGTFNKTREGKSDTMVDHARAQAHASQQYLAQGRSNHRGSPILIDHGPRHDQAHENPCRCTTRSSLILRWPIQAPMPFWMARPQKVPRLWQSCYSAVGYGSSYLQARETMIPLLASLHLHCLHEAATRGDNTPRYLRYRLLW